MVLVAALILALQTAPAPANAPADDPILVTSSRPDAVRFNLSVNRLAGEMKCTVARSSTDPAIDAYMCDVARHCARTSGKTRAAIEQCIGRRKQTYLARYRPLTAPD